MPLDMYLLETLDIRLYSFNLVLEQITLVTTYR
jgi:hypothetical protein